MYHLSFLFVITQRELIDKTSPPHNELQLMIDTPRGPKFYPPVLYPNTGLRFQFLQLQPSQGFVNCSFLNQRKKPAQTTICAIKPTQNHPSFNPCRLTAKFGKMGPGPVASGAQARATMVATDPRTCAHTKANTTWKRVRVWRRIMPKPTPWMASSVPSQSHRVLPASAPASGEPAHGTQDPMPEVAHSI